MARFSVNGIDELMLDFTALADLPEEAAEDMLLAEAAVVEKEQKETGRKMGVHRTGVTLGSITHGKAKRERDGSISMYVSPQGKNAQGNRNAEVAFVNEYGVPKRKIQARPFIRTANKKAAKPAVDAAEKVYDEYLKKKNL